MPFKQSTQILTLEVSSQTVGSPGSIGCFGSSYLHITKSKVILCTLFLFTKVLCPPPSALPNVPACSILLDAPICSTLLDVPACILSPLFISKSRKSFPVPTPIFLLTTAACLILPKALTTRFPELFLSK